MRKTFFYLFLLTFSTLFYACNSQEGAKGSGKSNPELNNELQQEHADLIKEHTSWENERREFQAHFDTLRLAYDAAKPQHDLGYDEIVEKLENQMRKHSDFISAHVKLIDEHTANLEKHQKGEITDKEAEQKHRDFYAEHKKIRDLHDKITDEYEVLIKKQEEFLTKAGAKFSPFRKGGDVKTEKKEEKPQADSTKK
jgi:hypothetical protein